MVHPCDKPCGNKTASGYCATTACINPQYSNIGTAQYGQGVQKRIVSNADRIRGYTDDELADWLSHHSMVCVPGKRPNPEDCVGGCEHCWLDWLRQEVNDDNNR